MTKKVSAVGLLSGGLDSILALRVILDQGVTVKAINCWTPFFTGFPAADTDSDPVQPNFKALPNVLIYARNLGCEVEVIDLSDVYLQMLHNPNYGYGRNVNPCIDCHILMFRTARRIMESESYDFVFTGEVLGQRPKSQGRQELNLIARKSGLEDRILRPLSAGILPPTLPETEGWVDRNRLQSFRGRTRKPQMALAEQYGITEYPTPAGGCILTEPSYGNKVRDIWKYSDKEKLSWEDYNLLRIGRHLRVNSGLKVVVGRHEAENNLLESYVSGRTRIEPTEVPGPVVITDESADPDQELVAARICARYCKAGREGGEVEMRLDRDGASKLISVKAFKPEEIVDWLIR